MNTKNAFAITFLFFTITSSLFALSKVDKLFGMVENKSVSVREIKKELSKDSSLYTVTKGKEKENLLMAALKADRGIDVITLLLDAGINPDKKTSLKKTSLMYACQYSSSIKVVEKVLETSAWTKSSKKKRILAKDKGGLDSFFYATQNPNSELRVQIEILLEKYAENTTKKTLEDDKPAIKEDDNKENSNKESITPIESVSIDISNVTSESLKTQSEKEEVQQLEKSDQIADNSIKDIVKESESEALSQTNIEKSEVGSNDNTKIATELETKEVVKKSTTANIDDDLLFVDVEGTESRKFIQNANKKETDGRTKLINAAKNSNINLVKDLLYSGATIDICDNEGCTALMYAARNQNNPEIVKVLLDNGANFRKRNDAGMTALMLAAKYNPKDEIIRVLLDKRSPLDLDVKAAFVQAIISDASIKTLQEFVDRGISVNMVLDDKTPLMYAAKSNSNTEIIKWLLDNGASKRTRTFEGKSALDFAKENPKLPRDDIFSELSAK